MKLFKPMSRHAQYMVSNIFQHAGLFSSNAFCVLQWSSVCVFCALNSTAFWLLAKLPLKDLLGHTTELCSCSLLKTKAGVSCCWCWLFLCLCVCVSWGERGRLPPFACCFEFIYLLYFILLLQSRVDFKWLTSGLAWVPSTPNKEALLLAKGKHGGSKVVHPFPFIKWSAIHLFRVVLARPVQLVGCLMEFGIPQVWMLFEMSFKL